MVFSKINYRKLNPRQQENYNFHRVAAWLAEYGFDCLRLKDDWEGADFIARHNDGKTSLKVQLKGRLTIQQKYIDKDLHVAFVHKGNVLIYKHDELVEYIEETHPSIIKSPSWKNKKWFSWPKPPEWAIQFVKATMSSEFIGSFD